VGNYAGWHHTTGAENTIIGDHAGDSNVTGTGNVFLGNRAGQLETGSNKLYIENTFNNSTSALIYGDFDANLLRFNANVGINTAPDVSYGLHVSGGLEFALYVSGMAFATGGFIDGSDERWKSEITGIDNALERVMKLRGVNFKWNTHDYPEHNFNDDPQVGFLAQEVEDVLPEIVQEDGTGHKGIDYSKLTPVLVEAIKEQQKQMEAMNVQYQKQIEELQKTIEELKKEINKN
jgi:hypothetical protein